MKMLRYIVWAVLLLASWSAPCRATVATVLVADGDHDTFLSAANPVYATSCAGSGAITNTANARIFIGDRFNAGAYTNYKGFLRFNLTGINGTVNSAKLYMELQSASNWGDIYVLRPGDAWWPGDATDWGGGTADTLVIKDSGDITAGWNEFDLDISYVPMGRYFDIRLEDEHQQTCDTPAGIRWSIWYSKDQNGTGDDTSTPYLVIDYDSTTVTCASVYVPNGASDGFLQDAVGTVCDGADADAFVTLPRIIVGEDDAPIASAAYGYIRYDLSAIPDSIQSAWMTFTVDAFDIDFGKVTLWKLDADFGTLDAGDWGASGTEIAEVFYDSLTVGETVTFDVTGQVTGGQIEAFQVQNEALCNGPNPLGDETIWLRSSEYAGTSSDPVMTVCYFPAEDQGVIRATLSTGNDTAKLDASGKRLLKGDLR